ncbi:CPBP family intramembrane glutamic endopeptidase [Rapidithrix thailandica]|uniref:CPBP family intramembrane glutamic endopeptidase n=1 Tax=Rapidithrix thailandica TaxID=413964 RepID=A0AAW9SIJ7_9BACT
MDILNSPPQKSQKPVNFSSLLVLVGMGVAGLFISQFAAFVVAMPFCNFDIGLISAIAAAPDAYPDYKTVVLLMQGASSIFLFIGTSLLFILGYRSEALSEYFEPLAQKGLGLALVTVVLMLMFMPFSGMLVGLNEGIDLPDSQFETMLRAMEDRLKELTLFLTQFDSFGQYLLGLVIVAVIPAIGEELLFRGVLQRLLSRLLKNSHVAIWLTAFLFGAFHFQFYGVIPRMMLGVLFGYLFLWSGNLKLPILAHFINNGFTLTMLYLYQIGVVETNLEEVEHVPWLYAFLSLAVSAVLLWQFKKIAHSK